jgi:hypothetical protein
MAIIKVKTGGITADAITSTEIADNAVVTAAINADAVTDAKIADDVVGTEHLTANEVDTAALGADAVTAAQIADDAISEEHLDVTAVTGHTAETSIADGDTILIHDASASALRKMTKANFTAGVGLAECSFRAYQSSSQNIANGTATQINLQTEDWDTDNAFASNTFTCPSDKAGKYIVVGAVRADTSWASTDQFNVMIYRNGASNTGGMSSSSIRNGVGNSGVTVQIIDMAVGDTLKLYLYHNEGGTEGLQTGQESTYMAGTRITS